MSLKKEGYDYKKGYIKIVRDGARIDGSHRSAILFHLNVLKVKVVVMKLEDFFTEKQISSFLNHLKKQQKIFGVL